MTEPLYEYLTQNQVNTYGLVLSSQDIPYFVRKSASGWEIWVEEAVWDQAYLSVTQFIKENQRSPGIETHETTEYQDSIIGVWMALLLIGCHLRSNMDAGFHSIVREYGASATAILDGEFYRTVTALMLHADYMHLAGNIAGIFIFGEAVGHIAGPGIGSLMILVTGILGNYANALLFEYGHRSIGASTAVFGAVGIAAAYQFYIKIKTGTPRMKAWLPLAGGLALLGFLGADKRADLTAHLFGFIAGIGLGLFFARFQHQLQHQAIQRGSLAGCIIIIVWAWL